MKSIALALAGVVLFPSSSLAGSPVVEPITSPAITTTQDDWEITLGLYVWGAGLEGDLGAAGNVAPVDISFSEILETLAMTAMGAIEFKKGRWMFELEGLYLKNSVRGIVPTAGAGPVATKLVAETTRIEPMIAYRVIDSDRTSLDLVAGAVYYDISNDISLLAAGPVGGVFSSGDGWWDPTVGLRFRYWFNDKWVASLRGEVGGFGVNADINWQVYALLGYRLNDCSTLFGGWRHAAVDYSNDRGFLYDVASSGPILGLAYTF